MHSQSFGTAAGKPVFCYILKNKNGVEARLTNYGATLQSLTVPDRSGNFADVVLGYDDVTGYANGESYHGATIGRYGNRIANAKFTVNGKTYTLAANNGPNALHGGIKAFHKVVWDAKDISTADAPAIEFTYVSPDGEEGFPGTLTAKITYTLTSANELKLDYYVTADQDTIQNLTNHSYFNLAADGDVLGHEVNLNADRFTAIDATLIPTGEVRSVEGTPFDFRNPTAIGARINADDEQLKLGKGYDHNWIVNGDFGQLRLAAQVYEPQSGRTLEVMTTEPGVQFYTGNFLNGEKGKGGKPMNHRSAFCLETQHYPNSPNQPEFPSTVLKAGQHYRTTTIFKFGTR